MLQQVTLGGDEVCQKCNVEAIHGGFHSRFILRAFSATVSASNSILLYYTGFNARRSLEARKEVWSSSIIRILV
jgi:hypothetical protein